MLLKYFKHNSGKEPERSIENEVSTLTKLSPTSFLYVLEPSRDVQQA